MTSTIAFINQRGTFGHGGIKFCLRKDMEKSYNDRNQRFHKPFCFYRMEGTGMTLALTLLEAKAVHSFLVIALCSSAMSPKEGLLTGSSGLYYLHHLPMVRWTV